jgi:hypothetical protein
VPDDHPDLDAFAHRDEPASSVRYSLGNEWLFIDTYDHATGELVTQSYAVVFSIDVNDDPCVELRYSGTDSFPGIPASEFHRLGAPLGERGRLDARLDLRAPPGRDAQRADPPLGDAAVPGAGGEPDAGAPAVPGGGTVPSDAYLRTDAAWDEHEHRARPFRHAHLHKHPRAYPHGVDAHPHPHGVDRDHHPL